MSLARNNEFRGVPGMVTPFPLPLSGLVSLSRSLVSLSPEPTGSFSAPLLWVPLMMSLPVSCTDSPVVKDPISDAGGPRFESQAGLVTGKPTPKPLEG